MRVAEAQSKFGRSFRGKLGSVLTDYISPCFMYFCFPGVVVGYQSIATSEKYYPFTLKQQVVPLFIHLKPWFAHASLEGIGWPQKAKQNRY